MTLLEAVNTQDCTNFIRLKSLPLKYAICSMEGKGTYAMEGGGYAYAVDGMYQLTEPEIVVGNVGSFERESAHHMIPNWTLFALLASSRISIYHIT